MAFTLTSPDFVHEGAIPTRFTCEGDDVSPGLRWSDAPEGTRSFALVVDDPDAPDPAAPRRVWVHWVLYNLPARVTELASAVPPRLLPGETLVGKNDWGRTGYGGPCPPIGRHRYFFTLHALDAMLPDLRQPTRAQLDAAMAGHVLSTAVLMGTYQKTGR